MAMVKIDYTLDSDHGPFVDAIWYDDASPMTDEEIETEKQNRLQNWLSSITASTQNTSNTMPAWMKEALDEMMKDRQLQASQQG